MRVHLLETLLLLVERRHLELISDRQARRRAAVEAAHLARDRSKYVTRPSKVRAEIPIPIFS
jgi:hypothetical protein